MLFCFTLTNFPAGLADWARWLGDETPGHQATWEFLDRRIDDVMQIEKLKAQVSRFVDFDASDCSAQIVRKQTPTREPVPPGESRDHPG